LATLPPPWDPAAASHIVSLARPGEPFGGLLERLRGEGIVCSAAEAGSGCPWAPYNNEDDIAVFLPPCWHSGPGFPAYPPRRWKLRSLGAFVNSGVLGGIVPGPGWSWAGTACRSPALRRSPVRLCRGPVGLKGPVSAEGVGDRLAGGEGRRPVDVPSSLAFPFSGSGVPCSIPP